MTSTTRQLSPHPGDDTGWAVFLPVNGAAFVGNADPGVDWLCVGCGQILLGSVHERQFLEVLVVCPSCGAHNGSPLRNAGEPVPGRSLLIPPGRYLLGSTVDVIDKPVMAAGEAAITAYVRETGARYGDWSGAREFEIGGEMSIREFKVTPLISNFEGQNRQVSRLELTDDRGCGHELHNHRIGRRHQESPRLNLTPTPVRVGLPLGTA